MLDNNHIVCTCLGITYGELKDIITENPNITLEELMDQTSAGTICGMCIDGSNGESVSLQSMLEDIKKS